MHLGNGAVTPECGLVAMGVAAAGIGVAWCANRVQQREPQQAALAGGLATMVFAAQMFNVPIFSFTSAHLVGGVLLAWMIGPALGLLSMSAVLFLQAMILGDGGLASLGANILNMGVLPAVLTGVAQRFCRERGYWASTAVLAATSFAAVVGAAGLVVLEVAIGRSGPQLAGLGVFATQMISLHLLLAVGEAAATVAIVAALGAIRERSVAAPPRRAARVAVLVAAGVAVGLVCSPVIGLSSALPDGYETALQRAEAAGPALVQMQSAGRLAAVATTLVRLQQRTTAWCKPVTQSVALTLLPLLAGIVAALLCGGAMRLRTGLFGRAEQAR